MTIYVTRTFLSYIYVYACIFCFLKRATWHPTIGYWHVFNFSELSQDSLYEPDPHVMNLS